MEVQLANTGTRYFLSPLSGRFVTGMGVGSLSMAVPLYNAEIAPPEVRGSLVALQQLAITFGIMISFWIDYGMSTCQNLLTCSLIHIPSPP
jgi:MFS family permease